MTDTPSESIMEVSIRKVYLRALLYRNLHILESKASKQKISVCELCRVTLITDLIVLQRCLPIF